LLDQIGVTSRTVGEPCAQTRNAELAEHHSVFVGESGGQSVDFVDESIGLLIGSNQGKAIVTGYGVGDAIGRGHETTEGGRQGSHLGRTEATAVRDRVAGELTIARRKHLRSRVQDSPGHDLGVNRVRALGNPLLGFVHFVGPDVWRGIRDREGLMHLAAARREFDACGRLAGSLVILGALCLRSGGRLIGRSCRTS
jgi:hypothetical protein